MADGPGRAGRGAKLGELPLAQLEELLSSAKTGRDEEPSAARTPKPRTPKQRQGTRTKRPASPGSTARKKSSKMEDEEWIATQPHDVSNAGDEVVDGPFWEVYRLQTSKEEFFQSQECCTGFFCMSRVWNEGLGAQCSFPRRPGGLPSPSPTCMRCFVTTAIFSVQRLGTLMSVDIRNRPLPNAQPAAEEPGLFDSRPSGWSHPTEEAE
ncbi:unnamed protein product [Durusdinium trenchii]|uniref:Uncharacterized protein n=1 Tax=Durusdinium trenchii TaxID=1381693 RepID=A0ABP0KXJ4_9DINO